MPVHYAWASWLREIGQCEWGKHTMSLSGRNKQRRFHMMCSDTIHWESDGWMSAFGSRKQIPYGMSRCWTPPSTILYLLTIFPTNACLAGGSAKGKNFTISFHFSVSSFSSSNHINSLTPKFSSTNNPLDYFPLKFYLCYIPSTISHEIFIFNDNQQQSRQQFSNFPY